MSKIETSVDAYKESHAALCRLLERDIAALDDGNWDIDPSGFVLLADDILELEAKMQPHPNPAT